VGADVTPAPSIDIRPGSEEGASLMISHPRTPVRTSAFTLAELVVVIVILATMAGIALPRYAQFATRQRIEAASRRLRKDLDYARRQARITGTTVTVTFNATNNTYQIAGVANPLKSGTPYLVDLKSDIYQSDILWADFAGVPSVSFDPFGDASANGVVRLRTGSAQKSVGFAYDVVAAVPLVVGP